MTPFARQRLSLLRSRSKACNVSVIHCNWFSLILLGCELLDDPDSKGKNDSSSERPQNLAEQIAQQVSECVSHS
jgi:hypothetical protein